MKTAKRPPEERWDLAETGALKDSCGVMELWSAPPESVTPEQAFPEKVKPEENLQHLCAQAPPFAVWPLMSKLLLEIYHLVHYRNGPLFNSTK
ncbi:hypothetical protein AV530_013937 [Patagioenas fasciata monilis]|uniref:Uncharacterized protein n=1 Tax=Patagioenas fasciata monilis TaxID=372326 RepID=A0A1V4KN03_PATFA|nr:hypothetical protein AV530_013937 [Patagioenas fasciata monilis]